MGGVKCLTFMMGMGSSPGAPRSSIMFLMSMERSAILRSVTELALCAFRMDQNSRESAHTSDDLDVVARDELDGLLSLGRHGC